MALIEVKFPGGAKVDAHMKGHVIRTDQPAYAGGEGSAPAPFELFLASMATCAGIFALSFCQNKGIETEGLSITMDVTKSMQTQMIDKVIFDVKLPEGFPMKYKDAIIRTIDLCSVKKTILNPPEFFINVVE